MKKVKCPNCNAQLKYNKERNESFCEYCGFKEVYTKTIQEKAVEIADNVTNTIDKTVNNTMNSIEKHRKYAWIPAVVIGAIFLVFFLVIIFHFVGLFRIF